MQQRILIIDDDRFFSRLASCIVASNGDVAEECNDPSGIDLQRLGEFDLILLDVMMPGIDGVQMLGSIRQHAPATPVVLMTSVDHAMADSIAGLAGELGILLRGVLHKPFTRNDILPLLGNRRPSSVGDTDYRPLPVSHESVLDLHQQLVAQFQPQVSLSNGHWLGCQVVAFSRNGSVMQQLSLATLNHREPVRVMDALLHLLTLALAGLQQMQQELGYPLSLTLPASVEVATLPAFAPRLLDVLARHQFQPGQLVLELADSSGDQDATPLLGALAQLKRHGIRLSLSCSTDEWATVFGDRHDLFDEFKLHQSLVFNLGQKAFNRKPVQRLIDLGTRLCIPTVADGITDADTAEWLRANGCDIGQGDHICPPLDAERLLQWHRAGRKTVRLQTT